MRRFMTSLGPYILAALGSGILTLFARQLAVVWRFDSTAIGGEALIIPMVIFGTYIFRTLLKEKSKKKSASVETRKHSYTQVSDHLYTTKLYHIQ